MSPADPFACNMHALSPEQRSRHHELAEKLLSALAAVHELRDGYEFEFPFNGPIYEALTEFTLLEHACCPFFTIAIRLENSKLFWHLTGSDGVKQFIRMEFAAWFK